jgi:hypothetical protein
MLIFEWFIGNDLGGGGCVLIEYYPGILLEGEEENTKSQLGYQVFRKRIVTGANKNQFEEFTSTNFSSVCDC